MLETNYHLARKKLINKMITMHVNENVDKAKDLMFNLAEAKLNDEDGSAID